MTSLFFRRPASGSITIFRFALVVNSSSSSRVMRFDCNPNTISQDYAASVILTHWYWEEVGGEEINERSGWVSGVWLGDSALV